MKIANCVQGSQEWFDARNGRVTASRIKDVTNYLKQTKAEVEADTRREGQKRIDYKTELIAEILTGSAIEHYVNDAMRWGIAQEAQAATEYELETDEDVWKAGFVYHPTIERAGASPDRIVGERGLLEVKCPETTTHLEWILAGVVPEEHKPQMYFQMRCCGREWVDFLSFDSRLPKRYQKFLVRLHADETVMDAIDDEVNRFLADVDVILAALNAAMPAVAAAPLPTLARDGFLTDADFEGLI